jgi:hypothetical protein
VAEQLAVQPPAQTADPVGGPGSSPARRIAAALAVTVVVVCFVLVTPRNGGPDEASHAVTSAALIRGERSGEAVPGTSVVRAFQVPAFVGQPDPACWAQQPTIPAGCATLEISSTDVVTAVSSAVGYPPWAYLLPSLASLVPDAEVYMYLARLLMAVIPIVLVVAALDRIRRLGRGVHTAALVGVTPIAWFTMGIVNPSAVAIGGGLALWAGLATMEGRRGQLLAVAGWLCVVLPRRDGPLWATLIVLVACLAIWTEPRAIWRSLNGWSRFAVVAGVVAAVSTVVTAHDPAVLDILLAAAPVGLLLTHPMLVAVRRSSSAPLVVASLLAGGVVALAVVLALGRRGGLEGGTARLIVSNTDDHLWQLVGVLGWLDTPVPLVGVFVFFALLGALLAVAALDQHRAAMVGVVGLVVVVCTPWLLEFGQGSTSGQYWQGRYAVPFSIGLPLVLALRGAAGRERSVSLDRLAPALAAAVWFVWNLGFAAALHRWGVGLGGSWLPWKWDTWGAPVPTTVLLIVHVGASAWLLVDAARPEWSRYVVSRTEG